MNLSIGSLAYLFLQLSPFIVVCYFTLVSIFNRDLKGIIYIFGLLVALTGTYMISLLIDTYKESWLIKLLGLGEQSILCNSITLGAMGLNTLPLGATVIGFTFWYLMFTLIEHDMKVVGIKHGDDPTQATNKWNAAFPTPYIDSNWPTITFFVILLAAHIFLLGNGPLTSDNCFNWVQQFAAVAIAGCFGIMWSAIIRSMNTPSLLPFSKYKNNEQCKKASNKSFQCTIYKNGVPLQNQDTKFTLSS